MTEAHATNHFAFFARHGFTRLVPIIPHDAPISPTSSMAKRKDARGKAVGVKGRDGNWHGIDWIHYEADADDLNRWARMQAGVGIKTGLQPDGRHLLAIDADTMNADHARTIRDVTEQHFGRLPVRVGRYPKALYLICSDQPYRYTRVEFGERDERGSLIDRVEILSDGRQFVAQGVHPVTKTDYGWPRDVTPYADLPTFTPDQIDAYMEALRSVLPAALPIIREGSNPDAVINQEALRGKPETIRKAVNALPNTSAQFPAREHYLAVGYAIKASLPDNEPEAFDIFSDWCARWQDGENDPEVVQADWRRMKPPYRRGAGYIYELAEQHNPKAFTLADVWFDVIEPSDNPFADLAPKPEATDTYPLTTLDALVSRPPPTWLIERHIPDKSVGFLYSEPGVGKTFLALDLSLAIAAGHNDWHGDRIKQPDPERPASVIYIASEGSFGMRNRVRAWQKRRNPNANLPKTFLLLEATINFMHAEDINRLIRTLRMVERSGNPPALVVVDTVSRALPGADENLQKDMTLFVRACDAVRDAFGCAVLGVHHAGKSGDMRGSTVLRGAGDYVFRLTRKQGRDVGHLTCEKQKDGPDGWEEPYSFETVDLGEGQSSWAIAREAATIGPEGELTPAVASAVLEAIGLAWAKGAPWAKGAKAGERWAVRRMVADFGFTAESAADVVALWERSGVVELALYDRNRRLSGYKVGGGFDRAGSQVDLFG